MATNATQAGAVAKARDERTQHRTQKIKKYDITLSGRKSTIRRFRFETSSFNS